MASGTGLDLGPARKKTPTETKTTDGLSQPDDSDTTEESGGAADFGQDEDLFFGFITESLEHIESIEVNIINLEQEPENVETLNAVFRPFHTIKGVSGFLNLKTIHHLTHEVENILDDARNFRLPVTAPLIDLVLDAVDILKQMIGDLKSSVETGQTVVSDYGVDAFIKRIVAIQQGDDQDFDDEQPSPEKGQRLGDILIGQGLLTEEALENILVEQETARLRRLGEILVEKGLLAANELEAALQEQLSHADKKLGTILVESGKANPMDISEALDEQEKLRGQKIGEILVREKRTGSREVTKALREQKKASSGGAMAGGNGAAVTVKVDTGKLDNLVDLVGELVIAHSQVTSNHGVMSLKDQKLLRDLNHLARITSELQRTAMGMRMVPISQTFQKMIRLVRDLSRKSGKQVELTMTGEDTEIDRNVVEAIYDPMVHMIRNSVDHGVEAPEERIRKGKQGEGRINLRAFHQGGGIVIEIEDDGQGLNREKILAKAVERGLVGPDEKLNDNAVFNLIFQPGFSTAEQITDVSGRGVGMDVVKKAIEKLRGRVEVHSEPGVGSTITIRLPLTLAIIDGMIVRVADNRYILPTMSIRESFRPNEDDYFTVQGQGELVRVRGHLLPLLRLHQLFGLSGSHCKPSEALVVVVESEGNRRCLMVDELLGKQEVVIKSMGDGIQKSKALAGASILGDGRVGLIVDISGLFEISDFGAVGRQETIAPIEELPKMEENKEADQWEMEMT